LFVNGFSVGAGGDLGHSYSFFPKVTPGRDVVAISGYNTHGPAAFVGSFGGVVTRPEDWRCKSFPNHVPENWNLNNFDDSNWSRAASFGRNNDAGTAFYRQLKGYAVGIPGDARWIWAPQNKDHKLVVCRSAAFCPCSLFSAAAPCSPFAADITLQYRKTNLTPERNHKSSALHIKAEHRRVFVFRASLVVSACCRGTRTGPSFILTGRGATSLHPRLPSAESNGTEGNQAPAVAPALKHEQQDRSAADERESSEEVDGGSPAAASEPLHPYARPAQRTRSRRRRLPSALRRSPARQLMAVVPNEPGLLYQRRRNPDKSICW
jgi:hypothetical protein